LSALKIIEHHYHLSKILLFFQF